MLSDNHVDGRVGHCRAFPDEGEPHIDVFFLQDFDGLRDFFLDHIHETVPEAGWEMVLSEEYRFGGQGAEVVSDD
jgi:hypothetical protein